MFFHNSICQTFFHFLKCQLAREIILKVKILNTNLICHYLFRLSMTALAKILFSLRSKSSCISLTVLTYSWSAVRALVMSASAVMLSLLSRLIWEGKEEGGEVTESSRMLCSSSTILARSSDTSEQVLTRRSISGSVCLMNYSSELRESYMRCESWENSLKIWAMIKGSWKTCAGQTHGHCDPLSSCPCEVKIEYLS